MANNFFTFKSRKTTVIGNFKVEETEELDAILENSDIDMLSYEN